jgi:uncharacterized protein
MPCQTCESKCCRYFALQIDTPRAKDDFENIRWFLCHEDVAVFIEKKKWYLEIKTKCRYLTKNNLCGIYDKRPLICREHDNSTCEMAAGHFNHTHSFDSLEEFDRYLVKRFRRKPRPCGPGVI